MEEQIHGEEKYLTEIKELKNALHSKEVEAHTASQILGAHISELETVVKRVAVERDAVIERESKTYQDLNNVKAQAKKAKGSLEKKLKGKSKSFIQVLIFLFWYTLISSHFCRIRKGSAKED
jgi:hypothetical protein